MNDRPESVEEMLLVLASWIEVKFPADEHPEVQQDLRLLAAYLNHRPDLEADLQRAFIPADGGEWPQS